MDSVTVTVEHDSLTPALERVSVAANAALVELARTTAASLQTEMRSRLARQTSGTGQTAEAITTEQGDNGYYRVTSGNMGARAANLPIWLEFGTKYMTPRPYFYGAIELEAGTYLRRAEDAMQAAIDGLGGA